MKGLESEVILPLQMIIGMPSISMTYLDAKNELTQAPYRQCPHERSRRTFLYDGKDNPWTMTRYNQWYRIISTAMGKITPTARRTSSSPRTLARIPTFMPVWTTF